MQKKLKLLSSGLAAGLVAGLLVLTAGCSTDIRNDIEHRPSGTLISISSEGKATQAPDIAHISAGVVTEADESKTAMQANAKQMDKLMKAIKNAGVDEKDVQTSGLSLIPRFNYQSNQKPQIVGYRANNNVNITVRKLDELSKVIDALAAEGANQIHGPNFSIDDTETLLNKARETALNQAKVRAEAYAKSLGTKVRRIVSISEGSRGGMPRPMMRAEAAVATSSTSTPIAPGESSVSVNLELVFELANN